MRDDTILWRMRLQNWVARHIGKLDIPESGVRKRAPGFGVIDPALGGVIAIVGGGIVVLESHQNILINGSKDEAQCKRGVA